MKAKELCAVMCVNDYSIAEKSISFVLSQIPTFVFDFIIVLDSDSIDSESKLRKQISLLGLESSVNVLLSKAGNPGGARNIGLLESRSLWTTFWDSDDLPHIESILSLLNQTDSINTDICVGSYTSVEISEDDSERVIKNIVTRSKSDLIADLGIWRIIFKTEFIKNLKFIELRMGEDQIFLYSVLNMNPKILFSDIPIYTYYKNSISGLTSNRTSFLDSSKAIRGIFRLSDEWADGNKKEIGKVIAKLALSAIKRGNFQAKAQIAGLFTTNFYKKSYLYAITYMFHRVFDRKV
jgi:glycosyltransferase involved in cell wall biosynthesis